MASASAKGTVVRVFAADGHLLAESAWKKAALLGSFATQSERNPEFGTFDQTDFVESRTIHYITDILRFETPSNAVAVLFSFYFHYVRFHGYCGGAHRLLLAGWRESAEASETLPAGTSGATRRRISTRSSSPHAQRPAIPAASARRRQQRDASWHGECIL